MTRGDRIERIVRAFEEGRRARTKKCGDAVTLAIAEEEHKKRLGVMLFVLAITETEDLATVEKEFGIA